MKGFLAAVEARRLVEHEQRLATTDARRLPGASSGGQRSPAPAVTPNAVGARSFRERQRAVAAELWELLLERNFAEARRIAAETPRSTLERLRQRWVHATTEAWPLETKEL